MVQAFAGDAILVNIGRASVAVYDQVGTDLVLTLVGGQTIKSRNDFAAALRASHLYRSADGHSHFVPAAPNGHWPVNLAKSELPRGEYGLPVKATSTDIHGNVTVVRETLVVDACTTLRIDDNQAGDGVVSGKIISGTYASTVSVLVRKPRSVIAQQRAGLVIYDTTFADHRATVGLAQFEADVARRILRLSLTLADLEKRHCDAPAKQHWFWGEFGSHKRQLQPWRCFPIRSMSG